MSTPRYEPTETSPAALLFENGWETTKEIAEEIGVRPNTIIRWDRLGEWKFWALLQIGFSIYYGDPVADLEARVEELEAALEEAMK